MRGDGALHRLGPAGVDDVEALARRAAAPPDAVTKPRSPAEPSSVATSTTRATRSKSSRATSRSAVGAPCATRDRDAPLGEALGEHARAARRRARPRRAARARAPSGTTQPWPSGPTTSIDVSPRALLGHAQRARAEDLVEDLDVLAVGAVHRERAPQDDVGARADAQVDELPGLHASRRPAGRAAPSGRRPRRGGRWRRTVTARRRGAPLGRSRRLRSASLRSALRASSASHASKSCSAWTSSRPSLTASMACTIAVAAGSVVMLVMPCRMAAARRW